MVEITDKFVDFKKLFQNMFDGGKQTKSKVKPKKNQGKLLWDSSAMGTYVRKKHGELK